MSPEFEQKLLIVGVALFVHTWVFVGTIVTLGTFAYLIGFPVTGGLLAILVACVYIYIKGILGK